MGIHSRARPTIASLLVLYIIYIFLYFYIFMFSYFYIFIELFNFYIFLFLIYIFSTTPMHLQLTITDDVHVKVLISCFLVVACCFCSIHLLKLMKMENYCHKVAYFWTGNNIVNRQLTLSSALQLILFKLSFW